MPDALSLTSLLEGNGITADVENELSALYVAGLPIGAIPFVVTIPAEYTSDAEMIVKEALKPKTRSVAADRRMRRLWMLAIVVMLLPVIEAVIFALLW